LLTPRSLALWSARRARNTRVHSLAREVIRRFRRRGAFAAVVIKRIACMGALAVVAALAMLGSVNDSVSKQPSSTEPKVFQTAFGPLPTTVEHYAQGACELAQHRLGSPGQACGA
jgi:hypothetical protein